MADLNALIAQGYQFQAPPDPFVQYGKMQQLENSAMQNRLAQQQMTEGATLAPYRLAEIKARSGSAELELKQAQDAQNFVNGIMQKVAENHGGINDPMEAAQQMLLNPNPKVQMIGKNLAEAHQLVEVIKQHRTYAQGEPSTGGFANFPNPREIAPGDGPIVSRLPAPVPLAPAAQGEEGTPVLTGNALAPPSVNAMGANRLAQIDKRLAALRQFSKVPEAVQERADLIKERDRLMTPLNVAAGGSVYNPATGGFDQAPEKTAAESPLAKLQREMAALPPGDSRRAQYAAAIRKETNFAPATPKDDPNTTAAFREVDNAGNVTFYNKFGLPITTQKGAGKPSATFEKSKTQKTQLVKELDQAIVELTDVTKDGGLIDQSTGSGVGRLVDIGARSIGQAMPGDIAIGKLQPIADLSLKMVPRFEGPQSNADTTSYKQAAGQLADPTLPPKIRKEAGKTVLRLMKARKDQFTTVDMAPSAAPAATGVDTSNPLLN